MSDVNHDIENGGISTGPESKNMAGVGRRERWIRAREALGQGAPTLLLGTSSRSLDRSSERLSTSDTQASISDEAPVKAPRAKLGVSPFLPYAPEDLSNLYVVRAAGGTRGSHYAGATASVAGGLIFLIALGPLLDTPASWAFASLVFVAAVPLGILWSRHERLWELRATYREKDVVLYRTSDVHDFETARNIWSGYLQANPKPRTSMGGEDPVPRPSSTS